MSISCAVHNGKPPARWCPAVGLGWSSSLSRVTRYGPSASPALWRSAVAQVVDFENVSTVGLESSPVAAALAGLRAHEARYYLNKYKHEFVVTPASKSKDTLSYVSGILKKERDLVIAARPLEASRFQVENIKMA